MPIRKKTAQAKSFFSKWGYITLGVISGYFTCVAFPLHKSISYLSSLHDYIAGSTLLTALVITIVTSFFKAFWNKRSEDR